jgi:signal transduction histidine kinase
VIRAGDAPGPTPCHTVGVTSSASIPATAGSAVSRGGPAAARSLGRGAWIADGVLALVVAGTALSFTLRARQHTVVEVRAPVPPSGIPGIVRDLGPGIEANFVGPGQLLLAVLVGLPLVVRRRYPLVAFWIVFLAALALHITVRDPDTALITFSACLIAAYSAVVYSPHRAAAIAGVVVGAVVLGIRHENNVPGITTGYLPFVIVLGLGLIANTVHRWKGRFVALQAERELSTARAVADERARIARELHDVVTHNVTVMLVQAGAARITVDARPDEARQALFAVESAGRAALTELRHLMGLLTTSADPADESLAPQPGLDQLPDLARQVTAAGVPVELVVTGAPSPLPPGTDLAVYRVVQEALTNVVKHAPGAQVRVTLDVGADAVDVDVTDTGSTPDRVRDETATQGGGRGLIGLNERVALYGGTLQAGPRLSGGYRVHATLPTSP